MEAGLPRLAGHLGVRGPDTPLFRHLADGTSAEDQIGFLARHGFAGVSDNYLLLREPDLQARIGQLAAAHGLEMASFVHDPLNWNQPTWNTSGATARAALEEALAASLAAARRSGSRTLSVVTGRTDALLSGQIRTMADHLRFAADRAAASNVVLCVETTHPAFAPGLLLERLEDALAVVDAADHPHVRLNFDIGHLALLGEDVLAAIAQSRGKIGMVQAADVPAPPAVGRIEPGAGVLDWPAIFAGLEAAGYTGLIELELEPAGSGPAGETALLERAGRFLRRA